MGPGPGLGLSFSCLPLDGWPGETTVCGLSQTSLVRVRSDASIQVGTSVSADIRGQALVISPRLREEEGFQSATMGVPLMQAVDDCLLAGTSIDTSRSLRVNKLSSHSEQPNGG